MGQVTFSWPDPQDARVLDGLALFFGYQAVLGVDPVTGNPIPNPETKQAYVKRRIREQIRGWVLLAESRVAAQQASSAAPPDVD